jgi:hypothetical protein
LAAHGDDAVKALRARGVRWCLVGDVKFLRKSYPFLSEAEYRTQFVEPAELLRKLLTRDATRTFSAARWEVWRLDAPPAGD